jgi:hypothetical protein
MAANMAVLHNWKHESYDIAKQHILAQLGDITGMRVHGRQVMVAVYVRPGDLTAGGLVRGTTKEQMNDWWEGKASLIVAAGPSAFTGTQAYLDATYHGGIAPQIGDWVITNASAGIQMNVEGENAERIKYADRFGDKHDTYPQAGWPVRVILDDSIIMTVDAPAGVV